jgi:hypothetical protein
LAHPLTVAIDGVELRGVVGKEFCWLHASRVKGSGPATSGECRGSDTKAIHDEIIPAEVSKFENSFSRVPFKKYQRAASVVTPSPAFQQQGKIMSRIEILAVLTRDGTPPLLRGVQSRECPAHQLRQL